MARATQEWHYVINGTIIPNEHVPEMNTGVKRPAWNGERNQFGEPVGFGVNNYCLLSWRVCPQSTYDWWLREIFVASPQLPFVRATDLMLYDPNRLGTPDVQYKYHGRFLSGVVHEITRGEENAPKWMRAKYLSSLQPYMIGDTHILIEYIGVVAPL